MARPRVDTHPPYERSLGPEAIDLAAAAGLVLDPWQRDSLTTMLAVRPDGRWRCLEYCELVPRQNGKGAILEARVLAALLLLDTPMTVWTAHEYKTAHELWLRVNRLLRTLVEVGELDEDLIKVVRGHGEQGFERLDTEQRVKFLARTPDSGRGFSGDLVIIDEAYAYTAAQQSALMPTMSARDNPQIIYTSSPPLTGDTGEVLYDLRERGDPTAPRDADAEPWRQDDSLAFRDWGLAGDLDNLAAVDLDDRAGWAAANPALPRRISVEFVGHERRAMRRRPASWARERLGIWPRRIRPAEETAAVIPDDRWEDLTVEPERPVDQVMAVQVDWARTTTTIAAVGPLPDGRLLASIVDHRPGTAWVAARCAELAARWGPLAWVVQDRGPSSPLLLDLAEVGIRAPEDRARPARGTLAVPHSADLATGYGMLLDAVTQGRLVHVGDQVLTAAVVAARTRRLAGGTAWDHRDPAVAPLEAVTQGVWAWLTRSAPVADYDVMASIG